ncbi:DUF6514 family protein [Acetivibrio cellulolyticus]|uniref:DUF6514 family protein n=1 Tax=Acetivibrio cellulolyticus TaxID=35830 RepID=UPI0001E2E6D7|nr:DUF6514 family protein [Acetivibrio cellulolyticus]
MLSKYLESRVELDLAEGTSTNSKIQLEYYLIESEHSQNYDCCGDKVYGIEIIKKESDNHAESEIVRNLSNSKENTKGILSILAKNTVTPIGLSFVLDDLMAL